MLTKQLMPMSSAGVWAEDVTGTPSGSAFAEYLMDTNSQLNSLAADVAVLLKNFQTLFAEMQRVKAELDQVKSGNIR